MAYFIYYSIYPKYPCGWSERKLHFCVRERLFKWEIPEKMCGIYTGTDGEIWEKKKKKDCFNVHSFRFTVLEPSFSPCFPIRLTNLTLVLSLYLISSIIISYEFEVWTAILLFEHASFCISLDPWHYFFYYLVLQVCNGKLLQLTERPWYSSENFPASCETRFKVRVCSYSLWSWTCCFGGFWEWNKKLPECSSCRFSTLQCVVWSWNGLPSSREVWVCWTSFSDGVSDKSSFLCDHVISWNSSARFKGTMLMVCMLDSFMRASFSLS